MKFIIKSSELAKRVNKSVGDKIEVFESQVEKFTSNGWIAKEEKQKRETKELKQRSTKSSS